MVGRFLFLKGLTMTLLPNIKRGMRWLDAHYPDWEWRINLQTLQLSSGCRCILGQLVGFAVIIEGERQHPDLSNASWARLHGFISGPCGPDGNLDGTYGQSIIGEYICFQDLTKAWKKAIRERRKSQPRADVSADLRSANVDDEVEVPVAG
jgi:hypothetical protein